MNDLQGSTETGEQVTPKPDTQPNAVESKADELLARREAEAPTPRPGKPGRPRGVKDSKPRKRPGVERRPVSTAPPEPAAPPAPPTEAEISGMAAMLGLMWRAACERVGRRPLTQDEARELAEAVVPVANKYGGGFLDKWGAEITLGMVAWGLWDRTAIVEQPTPEIPPGGEEAVQ